MSDTDNGKDVPDEKLNELIEMMVKYGNCQYKLGYLPYLDRDNYFKSTQAVKTKEESEKAKKAIIDYHDKKVALAIQRASREATKHVREVFKKYDGQERLDEQYLSLATPRNVVYDLWQAIKKTVEGEE